MKKRNFIKSWSALYALIILSGTCLVSCGDDESAPIINTPPTSSFSAPSDGLVGEEIQFTDNSSDEDGNIISWEWDFGDGNSSENQNPTHVYESANTYEVTLEVTDDGGLTDSTTSSITIQEGEEPEPTSGIIDRTLSHNSTTREYTLYIPTSYTGDVEVPLVVYLHGAPESKEVAQVTTDFIDVSEEEGFIMVFAEAGFEVQGQGIYIWADGRGAGGGAIDASFDDVSFINALVDALSTEFEINTAKRYLCGFSNGGSLAQRIAIQGNERFAAIATVSAGLHEIYETENPGRAIPMLFIHGTADEIASYDEGGLPANNQLQFSVPLLSVQESVDFWVANNQCDTTPVETDLEDSDTGDSSTVTTFEYSGGTNGAEVKLYRVNGGGHTWPGVVNATLRPEGTFGVNNNDVQAGQEIWDFFEKFELN